MGLIKQLRSETGTRAMVCHKALEQSEQNCEKRHA